MENNELWGIVDDYLIDQLQPNDPVLERTLMNNKKNHLPEIDVTPSQGKFLSMLVKMQGARNILEIGTLGGYSSIWFAQTLPEDGKIITLEANPHHAKVAKENINASGFKDKISIIEGPALETLPTHRQHIIQSEYLELWGRPVVVELEVKEDNQRYLNNIHYFDVSDNKIIYWKFYCFSWDLMVLASKELDVHLNAEYFYPIF